MKLIPDSIKDVYAKYLIGRGLLYMMGSLDEEDLKANTRLPKMAYGPDKNHKYSLTIGKGRSDMQLDSDSIYMYFKAEKPLVKTQEDKVKLVEFVLNGVYKTTTMSYQQFYGIEYSNKLRLSKSVSEKDIIDLPNNGRYVFFAVKM